MNKATALGFLAVVAPACTPSVSNDVELYDDGTQLTITGCGQFCTATNSGMTAVVDGSPMTVPLLQDGQAAPAVDGILELTVLEKYATQIPRPTAPGIELELNGATITLQDPGTFKVTAPSGPLSRAAGPVTITYAELAGTSAELWLGFACDEPAPTPPSYVDDLPATGGSIAIDLAHGLASNGIYGTNCSVTATIVQTRDASDKLDGSTGAMASATIVTVP
jgi:hypothetical protein